MKWISENERNVTQKIPFKYMPLISVIIPVYNVEETFLRECIESVLEQNYTNWELCIADDNSSDLNIKLILEEYKLKDSRVKVIYRTRNGHISACSNTALDLVTGEYTALLDNDDILAPFALYEIVRALNENEESDLIYSDEDKILDGIRCFPFFKTTYNKKMIYYINYICHLVTYRTSLLREVGGFREGYEGVQDWDLAIRVMALTDKVLHVPKILYHWRISESSTSGGENRKSYVKEARKKLMLNIKKA
ncbi:glycosyltransferase [Paenibacillus sp. FSL R5-0912]|uniref:glycosyltransferase family 2 protein n=1 Tax=Paenibacillus sp. FSL R5-0912 TaxID=1536771 RepID=UPI000693FBC9|nr:glycosyltransferase [Paenibacillus sp. FSL R5-0912]